MFSRWKSGIDRTREKNTDFPIKKEKKKKHAILSVDESDIEAIKSDLTIMIKGTAE